MYQAITLAIKRSPYNADRGDESSVLSRQRSVESVGVMQDVRGGGPWLVQVQDEAVDDEYEAEHWATLIEGFQRAYYADVKKENKAV